MNTTYKMTQSSRIKYFYKIQITTFLLHFLGFLGLVRYKKVTDLNDVCIILIAILIAWLLFFALPVFLLYYNHKKNSKDVTLIRDKSDFVFNNVEQSISFSMDDIEKIELWLTPQTYEKRIDFLFFGKYHYTSIYINKNQVINISCLVFDKTKKVFPEKLIHKRKKFFPFMK